MKAIHGADIVTLRTKGTASKINLDLFLTILKNNSLRGADLQAQFTTDTFLLLVDDLPAKPFGGFNRGIHRFLSVLNISEKSR